MNTEFNFYRLEDIVNQINSKKLNKDGNFLNLLLEAFSLMKQLLNFLENEIFHEGENTPHLDLFVLLICAEKIFSLKAIVDKENQNLSWLKLEIPFVRRITQLQLFKQLVRREREVIQLTRSGKFWCVEYVEEIHKMKTEFLDMYDGEEVRKEIVEALGEFFDHVRIAMTKKVNSKITLPPLQALEQDISSLKKIIYQIDLAVRSPSTNKALEKCVLQRALQVTGEFLKSTDSTAHVSKGTHDSLKDSQIPLSTLSSLRDLLSHSNSLLIRKRRVLEWHDHVLNIVREDLAKMRPVFEAILSDKETLLFRELIDSVLSIHEFQSNVPCIANGLQELKAKINIVSNLKQIQQGVETFLKYLEKRQKGEFMGFSNVKSGLRKIIFKIKYSNWEKDTDNLLELDVGYIRENFLEEFSKYMITKKRNAEKPPVKNDIEEEKVRLTGSLELSKDSPCKNKPKSVTTEINPTCSGSSYVVPLSSREIQAVKSVVESAITCDISEDKGQLPLNFLEILLSHERLTKVEKELRDLNHTTQTNADSKCSILIKVKIERKEIVVTIKHKEWKEGIDKYLEFDIKSKSLFETLTLSPPIQSKYETVELIIEEPPVPIPQKGILDVGKDLKITKDKDAGPKTKLTPIQMTESELRKVFDDMETSLFAKSHLNREEFDTLRSQLWPDMITKLSSIESERFHSVMEDFCKSHKHVSPQDLFPLMMLGKRMEQIRKTSQTKKYLVQRLKFELAGGKESSGLTLYMFNSDPVYEDTQKTQKCKEYIQSLSCWNEEDVKQLIELCDGQKWEEILHLLQACPDSYEIFCRTLAEFWFEGSLPTTEELSSILNLESEYTKLIVQNLEETLAEEGIPKIVGNKLNELKQKIESSWPKDEFKKLSDQIQEMRKWYEANARMESFLTSKITGQGSSVSQQEYRDLVAQLRMHEVPDFNCKNPGTFKKFKNAWLRGQSSKKPNPYGDLIKASANEKGVKIFVDSLEISEDQKTSLEQTFRSIEMEHLSIYFLQRLDLMSAMVHRYAYQSIQNYSPKNESEQNIMEKMIRGHLHDKCLLGGLAFILTDLLDLLKSSRKTLKVELQDSFLTRSDRRWIQLQPEYVAGIQFSIRNYLAHGDQMLEVILPELQDKLLILIALKLLEDGKSLMAFMKIIMDKDMFQYMTRLEENGNAQFCVNDLPESLKRIHAKNVEIFKKSTNWQQFLISLDGDEISTRTLKLDRDRILKAFGDEIFERIQRRDCSVISALPKIGKENILQSLTDSMLKWTVFEMAAHFGNFKLSSELITNYGFNNENYPRAMLIASESGNGDVVQLFLENQFPVHVRNDVDDTNWGVLHYASNINHQVSHKCAESVKLVEALIAAGADVNAEGVKKLRPVHLAAKYGYDCIVGILAQKGAELDSIETMEGMAPLHFGAQYGHEKVVHSLLVHNANPFALSKSGHTPLEIAAREGHLSVIRRLTHEHNNGDPRNKNLIELAVSFASSGLHFDITDYLTMTTQGNLGAILLGAVHSDCERVKKLILSGANVNYCDSSGNTALHSICGSKHDDMTENQVEVVKHLLSSGAVAGSINAKGQTPLHIVMTRPSSMYPQLEHRLKIIKLLVEFCADPSDVDSEGQTPLHYAAGNNCEEVIRYFAAIGVADFTRKDFKGRTSLHHSCLNPRDNVRLFLSPQTHLDCFKAVLAMSSKVVNDKDSEGKTPLHSAICRWSEEVIKLLLDRGADVFAGHESKSVLHEALIWIGFRTAGLVQLILDAMKNDPRKSQFLNAKDRDGMTPLMKACHGNHTMAAKLLVQYGADVNLKNETQNDKTALHYAARMAKIELVEFLLEIDCIQIELKADIDSVLHDAVRNRNEDVFDVILNKIKLMNAFSDKIDWLNFPTRNGNTPLMWAAGHGRLQIMSRLLEEGVDVNFQSPKGRTALHWAAATCQVNSIRFLLSNNADVRIRDKSELPFTVDLWNKYGRSPRVDEATIREIKALLLTGLDGLTS